ncbi:polysaccharide deacetylase family protein [Arthrobacter sp. UNC362MFTsu5.1]|uniref:polysaccharide deacetylase family protein n=1 Tax=Arthrobacter sp. UNC362MFTsu5.1 TaxID=1449044 RepID=UPI001E588F93|nr:polysaccharide deacetylase family protein [Arthrobacter sp. UNC362MFTsu5.1]
MESVIETQVPGPRRDFVGYGPHIPRVTWPHKASLALNFVVNYEEGSEYSHHDGDGRNEDGAELPAGWGVGPTERDLCSESVFEYGSRAGVWRLFRLFEEFGIHATVFACAVAIERNPAVGEWIQRAGHDVLSHGWRWNKTWELSRDEERKRIALAIESITKTCGAPPSGWYCRYSPSVNTRELIAEFGDPLIYDSDSYNDDLPYFTDVQNRRQLVVPYNSLPYNDARVTSGMTPSDFVDMCKRGIDEYRREGLAGYPKMMSIGLHTRWAGQAGRASAVREIIEYAQNLGDVWIARRVDIARWWLDRHEQFTTG